GEAEAAATAVRGDAEGSAVRAKGLAEAEAIKARADALATNHEALIGQQLAEEMPAIVAEAAKAFGSIGNFTVLSGAEGGGQAFSQVLGMGAAAIPMLRGVLEQTDNGAGGNGASADATPEPEPAERPREAKR